MAAAAEDHERQRAVFAATFAQARPELERRAAAGDAEAAAVLADGEALLAAELALVSDPEREGYYTLAWVLPEGKDKETPL